MINGFITFTISKVTLIGSLEHEKEHVQHEEIPDIVHT